MVANIYTGKNFRFLIDPFYLVHFYLSITNPKKFFKKNHFWAVAGPKTGNIEKWRKSPKLRTGDISNSVRMI